MASAASLPRLWHCLDVSAPAGRGSGRAVIVQEGFDKSGARQ